MSQLINGGKPQPNRPAPYTQAQISIGGFNGQLFVLQGGELYGAADGKPYQFPQAGRIMTPLIAFPGPCILIYMNGLDAQRFLNTFGTPPSPGVGPMVQGG